MIRLYLLLLGKIALLLGLVAAFFLYNHISFLWVFPFFGLIALATAAQSATREIRTPLGRKWAYLAIGGSHLAGILLLIDVLTEKALKPSNFPAILMGTLVVVGWDWWHYKDQAEPASGAADPPAKRSDDD